MSFDNRVTRHLGVDVPILSAPMGWVALPRLVAAVSEAGGLGLVPGSLPVDVVRGHLHEARALTDRPVGVNIPIAFARDPRIVEMIVEEGVRFVTTSAGSPDALTPALKDAGLTVYHVVPTLRAAQKAADAGVDGLVVEGSEGGGFKSPAEVSTMVLVPLVAQRLGLPVIAAGGIADGASMLAAFALGAEGVQMGSRMLASTESGVHEHFKDAVVAADETATVMYNRSIGRPMRVLRTATTEATDGTDPRELLSRILDLYEGGDLDASLGQLGQVAGRIDDLPSVAEIVARTVAGFDVALARLSAE